MLPRYLRNANKLVATLILGFLLLFTTLIELDILSTPLNQQEMHRIRISSLWGKSQKSGNFTAIPSVLHYIPQDALGPLNAQLPLVMLFCKFAPISGSMIILKFCFKKQH